MNKRKKIVAGNWKMNKTKNEAFELINEILKNTFLDQSVCKIIFPSFPLIPVVHDLLNENSRDDFFIGAQNCHQHDFGAFTGEVSAATLFSLGCSHVILGHSERRQYFGETDDLLKQKISTSVKNKLTPVFCVGEPLEIRNHNTHFDFVRTQLKEVLQSFNTDILSQLIIAYEPIWAIGTGETASPDQAQQMHAFIRSTFSEIAGVGLADQIPILYGGSCNRSNAREIFSCPDVDGGLIGGASLKADDFVSIINSF